MMPHKTDVEAMLRSISAQSRTNVIPTAATATGLTAEITFFRLVLDRKLSVANEKKMISTTNVTSGATMRALRPPHASNGLVPPPDGTFPGTAACELI